MIKKSKLKIIFLVLIFLFVSLSIFFYAYNKKDNTASELTTYSMGTYIKQTVYGKNSKDSCLDVANAINELENRISHRKSGSDIENLNLNAGISSAPVNEQTLNILLKCYEVSGFSAGVFDITVLPLSSLWGFDTGNNSVPDQGKINSALTLVNYKDLSIDTQKSTAYLKNKGQGVDLGAVGKGAACDEAVKTYKDRGVNSAIISVGGSVGVYGKKYGDQNWVVAVRDPSKNVENESSPTMGNISIESGFVSTSGIYEKYFETSGNIYHHILNTSTGYPVENNLLSVSVCCDNGALSDILSTTCFALGIDKSIDLLNYYNAKAIFIDKDKNVYLTQNIKNNFTITNNEYKLCNLS